MSAVRDTLGSSASPEDSYKDYCSINMPLHQDWESYKAWSGRVQLLLTVNKGMSQGCVLGPSFLILA